MIAREIGVTCSPRAELVLALSYLREKDRLLSIAAVLAQGPARETFTLARKLMELPEPVGRSLAQQTVEHHKVRKPQWYQAQESE